MTQMRPIAELMFGDFALLAMDQIVNQAAKIRYMTGGQCKVPMTIRLAMGPDVPLPHSTRRACSQSLPTSLV